MKMRILIVVNKNREAKGFLDGFDGCKLLPAYKDLETHEPPEPWYRMADFRARYEFERFDVIIRCIEDIMPPADSAIPETSGSNSKQKAALLGGYIRRDSPNLILSVSTAESTPSIQAEGYSQNGSVVVGGGFFTFDAREFDKTSPSDLEAPAFAPSNAMWGYFELLKPYETDPGVVGRFKTPPHSPSPNMSIFSNPGFIAVAAINVIHYQAYEQADPAAYEACCKAHGDGATIETTHGIVRMCAQDRPTIFLSPITDRYKCFKEDVDPDGEQNYAASYNAGVTAALFLRELDKVAHELIKIQ